MQSILETKVVVLVPPQVKNNGAFDGNTYVDTSEAAEALFLLAVGTTDVIIGSGDTSTEPFIEECDTPGGSYEAVDSAALSAVIAADDDDKVFGIHVDLRRTHKRYMRINAPTAGNNTGGALCAVCLLSRRAKATFDAAGMGLEELVKA